MGIMRIKEEGGNEMAKRRRRRGVRVEMREGRVKKEEGKKREGEREEGKKERREGA